MKESFLIAVAMEHAKKCVEDIFDYYFFGDYVDSDYEDVLFEDLRKSEKLLFLDAFLKNITSDINKKIEEVNQEEESDEDAKITSLKRQIKELKEQLAHSHDDWSGVQGGA